MAKIADADKMRAGKLDSAWVKAVWVGRVDRSNEHLLLTTKGCIRSRVVRRVPDGNQASYHAEVQGLPWGHTQRKCRDVEKCDGEATTSGHEATRDDPMPGSSDDHRRQTATETDVIEQGIVMDSGIVRVTRRNRPRSVENGSRRRYFSRGTGTTKIEKQTTRSTIVDR